MALATQPFDGRLDHEDGLFDRLFQVKDKASVGLRLNFRVKSTLDSCKKKPRVKRRFGPKIICNIS